MSISLRIQQTNSVLGDVQANLASHLECVERARNDGVDLCVFPELSLTGYFLKDLVPEVALPLDDPVLAPLLEASRDVSMVVGLVERSADFRYFNTACYLEAGRLVHAHRKIYLPTYGLFEEQRYFAAGNRIRAFDSRHGRLAMLTCEDLWHAAPALVAAQDGALAILVTSASPLRGAVGVGQSDSGTTWEVLNRFHAKTNGVYVVYANRVGFEDGVNFGGGSEVILPSGVSLAKGGVVEEATLDAQVDFAEVLRERRDSPLYRDEDLELAIRELQRVHRRRTGSEGSA